MKRSILSSSLFLLAALVCAAPAIAQQSPEKQARALHEEGLWHYESGRYDEAIAAFLEAHEMSDVPAIFYNVAQAYRLKGECREAVENYEKYLRLVPDGRAVAKAKEHLAELRPCEEPPPEEKTEPAPEPAGAKFGAGSGGEVDAKADKQSSGKSGALRLSAYGSLGLGAALLGAGGYFAYRADQASNRVGNLWENGGDWNERFESIESDGRRSDLLAKISLGAGGLALTAGAVLFFLSSSGEDSGPEVGVSTGRGGASVWATWTM